MVGQQHADQNLIDAHQQRMETIEGWCNKLEGYVMEQGKELKSKASTFTVIWGVGIMIIILGSLLAVIWGTVIENGKILSKVQRTQDLVIQKLEVQRPDQ